MASQAQIDANRRNAQKSTGPVTPEGKAAVRHNSVRHGLRSRHLDLSPGKDAEFTRLCEELEAAWQPLDQPERIQVETMAIAYWKLARVERDANIYLESLEPEKRLRFHAQVAQIQSSLERSYVRAQREFERLRKTRDLRAVPEEAAATAPTVQPAAPDPQPSACGPTDSPQAPAPPVDLDQPAAPDFKHDFKPAPDPAFHAAQRGFAQGSA